MICELISNEQMTANFESEWIPLAVVNNEKIKAASLQISWTGVSGTLNGTVDIYVSNDIENMTNAFSCTIDSASNSNDAILIVIYPMFRYLKLCFTKNDVTGGFLNALINYTS